MTDKPTVDDVLDFELKKAKELEERLKKSLPRLDKKIQEWKEESDDCEVDWELYQRMFDFIEDLENSTGDGKDPLKAEFWEKHKVTDEEKDSFLSLLCQTFRQVRRNNSEIIECAA